jgi:dihydrofolate synthase / folylpolyglutamate synthase
MRFAGLLPEGACLWLDGGHNQQGGEVLRDFILERAKGNVWLVCGMLKTKDSAAYFAPLSKLVKEVHTVGIEGEPLSQPPEQLQMAATYAGMKAFSAVSVEKALQTIAQRAKTPDMVIIGGSLSLVGRVLADNE